jgi:phage shock protein E
MRSPVRLAALPALMLLAVVAPACGSDDAKPASAESVAKVVLIDVRTPDEFVAGHLDGAINLDYEGGALEAAIADLDPSATYQVYCHSGRRSALATALLADHGFAHVTDLGGIAAAEDSTGLGVVQGD